MISTEMRRVLDRKLQAWDVKNSGTQQMALGTKAMWLNVMTPSQRRIIASMKATAAASVGEMEAG